MRNKFAQKLYKYAVKDKNVFVVAADISPSGDLAKLQKKYPDRFLNIGVAEQSMIGLCAGLSIMGKKAYAYSISTFSLYRPFEMIRDDLCYQNLPVTVVGMGAGTIYSSLGNTHMTIEDVSIARSIPNMKILAPCDPNELEQAVEYSYKNKKNPIYLRIGKSGEKNFTDNRTEKWTFGKIRKIQKGKRIALLSYGPIMRYAFLVSKMLENKINIKPNIYSCHTLKPFDKLGLKKIFKSNDIICVIKDHSIIGGLSSIVKQLAFDSQISKDMCFFSLKDKFLNEYSNQENLLKKHGISPNKIFYRIKKFIND